MGRAIAAALAVFACVSPASGQHRAVVPAATNDIVLDGFIQPAEWAEAIRLGGGDVELLVQEREEVLELALRTPPVFVASLCFERGAEIHVLHSSSAVGSATYRRSGDDWHLVQPFEWRLRGTDDVAASAEEQSDHMRRFGWVATTVVVGAPGETEFRVSARFWEGGIARVAIGLLRQGHDPAVSGWPLGPGADGCTQRTTIAGPLTYLLRFSTYGWIQLALLEGGG